MPEDTDAVKAFMKETEDSSVQLNATASEFITKSPEAPTPTEEDEGSPRVEGMDPVLDPNQANQSKLSEWSFNVDALGSVTVTPEEKKIYTKALVHDTPVQFTIRMSGIGVDMTFQSVTTKERDFAFSMVNLGITNGDVLDVATHLTHIQRYLICFMLVSVSGVPVSRFVIDETESLDANLVRFAAYVESTIIKMNGPRWKMITRGAAVFEAKTLACDNAIDDSTFFDPVD